MSSQKVSKDVVEDEPKPLLKSAREGGPLHDVSPLPLGKFNAKDYYDDSKGKLNDHQLSTLSSLLSDAAKQEAAYAKASKKNRTHDKHLQTVIGILLALTCGGSIISAFYSLDTSDPHFWGKLLETFLVMVCAVAQVVALKWKFGIKAVKHHKTASEFRELLTNAKTELTHGVDSRIGKCEEFVEDVTDRVNDINNDALPL